MLRYVLPILLGQGAQCVQLHDAVGDGTKKMGALGGADGNKIGAVAAIIPMGQAGGGDAVFVLVFVHVLRVYNDSWFISYK